MNKFYSIKPRKLDLDAPMVKLDAERRAKVEKKAGKLTDEQWRQYKSMRNITRSKF